MTTTTDDTPKTWMPKPRWGLQPATFAEYMVNLQDHAVLSGTAYVLFAAETGIAAPAGEGPAAKKALARAKTFAIMRQPLDPLHWAEICPDDDPDCPGGDKIGHDPVKLLALFKQAPNGAVAATAGYDLYTEIQRYAWPLAGPGGDALSFLEQVNQGPRDMRALAMRGARLADGKYPVTPAALCIMITALAPAEFEPHMKSYRDSRSLRGLPATHARSGGCPRR